ncbi:unnamed protein product [Cutaneotrichosporon oleaginosum]
MEVKHGTLDLDLSNLELDIVYVSRRGPKKLKFAASSAPSVVAVGQQNGALLPSDLTSLLAAILEPPAYRTRASIRFSKDINQFNIPASWLAQLTISDLPEVENLHALDELGLFPEPHLVPQEEIRDDDPLLTPLSFSGTPSDTKPPPSYAQPPPSYAVTPLHTPCSNHLGLDHSGQAALSTQSAEGLSITSACAQST